MVALGSKRHAVVDDRGGENGFIRKGKKRLPYVVMLMFSSGIVRHGTH